MIRLHLVLFCSEQEANTLDFLKSNLVLTAGNSRVISVPILKKKKQSAISDRVQTVSTLNDHLRKS